VQIAPKTRLVMLHLSSLFFLLLLVGFCLLYSAEQGLYEGRVTKQTLYLSIIFFPMLILVWVDINLIFRYAYIAYIITIALLMLAELLGYAAMGAQRWLRFGPINIQPSELMKIGLILALARYYHNLHFSQLNFKSGFFIPALFIALPTLLIVKQPNLGTATILVFIGVVIMFAAGVQIWKFVSAFCALLACLPIIWFNMHDYQKTRVMTFLNPEHDKLGASYNIIQSKIAIGSGGLFGKGFMNGTQAQLSFLPEKHTDFIFTLLAEEFGLIGCLVVLGLYLCFIFYSYYVALSMQHQFGRLVITGVVAMLFIHIMINISMISGLIPVVGTPLPLLSYGGSNIITMLLGLALILNCALYKDIKIHKV
jgi:rod shape determining protein RodA